MQLTTFTKYIGLREQDDVNKFFKFCMVGGVAAVIHFSLLYLFTEYGGLWYAASNAIGFLVSASFNFTANKFWTFQNNEKSRPWMVQLLRFSLVLITGLVIVTVAITLLTEKAGLDYRVSWVFATGAVTFWNFFMNKIWTFSNR